MKEYIRHFVRDLMLVRLEIGRVNIPRYGLNILDVYVLLLEDRRFFIHFGFDIFSIARSFYVTICGGYGGGASTIEQQLVRTITNRRERSLVRKIREVSLAFIICMIYKKEIILKAYLSLAYLGSNIKGVSTASERLFKKVPANLSNEEAAYVAGLLKYPFPKNTNYKWKKNIERRKNYAIFLKENHLCKKRNLKYLAIKSRLLKYD